MPPGEIFDGIFLATIGLIKLTTVCFFDGFMHAMLSLPAIGSVGYSDTASSVEDSEPLPGSKKYSPERHDPGTSCDAKEKNTIMMSSTSKTRIASSTISRLGNTVAFCWLISWLVAS